MRPGGQSPYNANTKQNRQQPGLVLHKTGLFGSKCRQRKARPSHCHLFNFGQHGLRRCEIVCEAQCHKLSQWGRSVSASLTEPGSQGWVHPWLWGIVARAGMARMLVGMGLAGDSQTQLQHHRRRFQLGVLIRRRDCSATTSLHQVLPLLAVFHNGSRVQPAWGSVGAKQHSALCYTGRADEPDQFDPSDQPESPTSALPDPKSLRSLALTLGHMWLL